MGWAEKAGQRARSDLTDVAEDVCLKGMIMAEVELEMDWDLVVEDRRKKAGMEDGMAMVGEIEDTHVDGVRL